MHRDGEAEAHLHPGRVALHRRVDETPELGEVHDLVEAPADLLAGEAEDRAVQVGVLPAGELRVDAALDLDQRADAAGRRDVPRPRIRDAGDQLEGGGLSAPVRPDDADGLPVVDVEGDVGERPDVRDRVAASRLQAGALQRGRHPPGERALGRDSLAPLPELEPLPDLLEPNDRRSVR